MWSLHSKGIYLGVGVCVLVLLVSESAEVPGPGSTGKDVDRKGVLMGRGGEGERVVLLLAQGGAGQAHPLT